MIFYVIRSIHVLVFAILEEAKYWEFLNIRSAWEYCLRVHSSLPNLVKVTFTRLNRSSHRLTKILTRCNFSILLRVSQRERTHWKIHQVPSFENPHCVKVSIVQGGTNSFALISSSHLFRCPFFSSVFFHFFQLFSSYFSHFLPTWATVHLLSDYFGFLCNLWQLEKICTTVKTYKM